MLYSLIFCHDRHTSAKYKTVSLVTIVYLEWRLALPHCNMLNNQLHALEVLKDRMMVIKRIRKCNVLIYLTLDLNNVIF